MPDTGVSTATVGDGLRRHSGRAYAMHMQAKKRYWTVQEVLDIPADGNRYEVVGGELFVTPAPTVRHQWLVGELLARLRYYLRAEGIGTAFTAPLDFYI